MIDAVGAKKFIHNILEIQYGYIEAGFCNLNSETFVWNQKLVRDLMILDNGYPTGY